MSEFFFMATITFGMGLTVGKFTKWYILANQRTWRPSFKKSGMQAEMAHGAHLFLSYQSFQLTNVETDIMNFIKSKLCRRKLLLDFFDVQCLPKEPLHLCNNCSLECRCGLPQNKIPTYPSTGVNPSSSKQLWC